MRAFALVLALAAAGGACAEDKVVKPDEEWTGGSPSKDDNDRWKKAPRDWFVADAAAWEKVWKDLNPTGKELPKVDFEKELVLVAAGPGPNLIRVEELKLGDKGDLRFAWSITERGGDGFVSKMLKVKRDGVKTVNGRPVGKE